MTADRQGYPPRPVCALDEYCQKPTLLGVRRLQSAPYLAWGRYSPSLHGDDDVTRDNAKIASLTVSLYRCHQQTDNIGANPVLFARVGSQWCEM